MVVRKKMEWKLLNIDYWVLSIFLTKVKQHESHESNRIAITIEIQFIYSCFNLSSSMSLANNWKKKKNYLSISHNQRPLDDEKRCHINKTKNGKETLTRSAAVQSFFFAGALSAVSLVFLSSWFVSPISIFHHKHPWKNYAFKWININVIEVTSDLPTSIELKIITKENIAENNRKKFYENQKMIAQFIRFNS